MIGTTLSHYSVTSKVGEGGMGVVYAATDIRLGRVVAIKVLPPAAIADEERRARFIREARAASALNHPNIVTIHDIDSVDGIHFMVMELVAGRPLSQVIPTGGLPVNTVLDYAAQIVSALKVAHSAGIVHRDIKPANIMVADDGRVKVLDFGLAKLAAREARPEESTVMVTDPTAAGTVLGTVAYMSPEQARGLTADSRSDIFSFGAVLHEMLTGRRMIAGDSAFSALATLLEGKYPQVGNIRPDVPADLARLVARTTDTDPAARPSADEIETAILALRPRMDRPSASALTLLRRPIFLVPLVVLLVLSAAGGWSVWRSAARARWARNVAMPEIQRLSDREEYDAAYRLAQQALTVVPDDPHLRQMYFNSTVLATITSDPPDSSVEMKGYLTSNAPWYSLGRTPLTDVRIPYGMLRVRMSKDGYQSVEASLSGRRIAVKLEPVGAAPPGMVRVVGGPVGVGATQMTLGDFWMDAREVTNKQFKAFVDAGGYRTRRFWQVPFVDNGKHLDWEQATARLRDATGRPGPAGWELGAYPDGQDDLPVGGVSWYEAAAYAVFAGKALPTIYDWTRAADFRIFSDILAFSNFSGKGPVTVGSADGIGAFGTYDMAGNVKEWCWNESQGKRFILGGAWNEPSYRYTDLDGQQPLTRASTHGFRLVKYISPPLPAALASVERPSRDYSNEPPVSDQIFEVYRSLYRYDRGPLNSKVEVVEELPTWRRETVTFDAAYGGERMRAHLFLPLHARPPYQSVVYFPGSDSRGLTSSRELRMRFFEFLIKSGRAVMFPIYKGTYERGPSASASVLEFRDLMLAWGKDLGRSMDYLETRPDIDRGRFAFYGLSLGAEAGVTLTAVEQRFKASILLAGGLSSLRVPGEIDTINFAPRVRVPTLMINGREDFEEPLEAVQKPLFNALGPVPADKKHAVFPGGHLPPLHDVMRETLDWLDRYLGRVERKDE